MNCAAHDRARTMPLLVGALVVTLDSFSDLDGCAFHLQPPAGPDLDGCGPCVGKLRSDPGRFVEVLVVEQAAAADLLLGPGKPAVEDQDLAVANLDGRRVAPRPQTHAPWLGAAPRSLRR
jgi:hypothetical protein